jgi:ankyrin repeat protein
VPAPVEMRTALFYAALFRLPSVVEILLDSSLYSDPKVQGFVLSAAVTGGSHVVIEQMVARNIRFDGSGGESNESNEVNQTLVISSVSSSQAASSTSTVSGLHKWNGLHFAAVYGIFDGARLLLLNGAEANLGGDIRDIKPFHLAAYYGHTNVAILAQLWV